MFLIRARRCTECQICMQVCSFHHFGLATTKRSRIRVEADWPEKPTIRVCLDCPGRECIAACPNKALSWGGFPVLDPDLCDSCGECAAACPVDGIAFDPVTDLPLVCDTCGGEYLCVKSCPTQALERKRS